MTKKHHSIIPIFVPHAGCKNACVFCDQRTISGAAAAPNGAEVARLLEEGLQKIGNGPAEAAFYGGSFTATPFCLHEELLSAVRPY